MGEGNGTRKGGYEKLLRRTFGIREWYENKHFLRDEYDIKGDGKCERRVQGDMWTKEGE